jgi:hypothetical protein
MTCRDYPRLGSLNNRNGFAHSSEGWKSEIKVTIALVSSEASFSGFQTATFCLCVHLVFTLYICASCLFL